MAKLIILAVVVYAGCWLCRACYCRVKASEHTRRLQRQAAAENRRRQMQREAAHRKAADKVNQAARLMQIALLQLQHSPDFRRAATFARRTGGVPVTFRRRQFQRFRPRLVEHLALRLRQGMDVEDLMPGLTELVTALGIAAYEADYIRLEVESQRPQHVEPRPGFASQMRQLQSAHQQRLDAIRSLPDLAPELLEQLVESEQERFRDRLFTASDNSASPQPDQP